MKLPDFGSPWIASRPSNGYEQDKFVAEAMLRRLCLGTEVLGAQWPGFPSSISLIIEDNPYVNVKKLPQYAQYATIRPIGHCVLGISNGASVLDSMPEATIEGEQAIAAIVPRTMTDAHLAQLSSLHSDPIVAIRLGVDVAHLIIQFDSGRCLFVKGDHPMYESWQMRVVPPDELYDPAKQWLLVNMPGGGVCMWTPADFDPNFDAEWHQTQEKA